MGDGGRVKYPVDYCVYAERYGYKSGDTVRAWVRLGKARGDLPPLEEPLKMIEWWRGNMEHNVPDGILLAARGCDPGDQFELDGGVLESPPVKPPPVSRGPIVLGDLELGELGESADDALRQCQALQGYCFEQLQAALKINDHAGAERWRKDWTSAAQTRRQWEKDFNRIQEERGHLLRKTEVLEAAQAMASGIARGILAAMLALGEDLAPEMDRGMLRKRCLTARDSCFESLKKNRFAEQIAEGVNGSAN